MSDQDWVDDPHPDDANWVDDHEAGLGERLTRATLKSLPAAGAMFGGAAGAVMGLPAGPAAIATGVGGAGLGAATGEALKNLGERYLLGDEKTREDIYAGPAKAALEGVTYEMGGQALGAVPGLIKDSLHGLATPTSKAAEKFAVNSTGATGAQSSKFADDAGRQLLDRKLVRFGDNAENIAKRVGAASDDASSLIDSSLKALDANGVTASADNVVSELQKTIANMKRDPSKVGTVKKLQAIIDDIIETGESNIPISLGEETKRGFRKAAGNWMDPDAGQAGKQAYLSYMDEVERAAQAADPALANSFKEGKETFGLLAPIQEAAEKRAATLNQSPLGGLLDVATAGGAGATVGGPMGMVTGATAAVGRRMLTPRISSSAAVTLDKISKALMKSPEMATLYKNNPTAFKGMVQAIGNRAGSIEQGAPISLPKAADKDNGQGAMNFNDQNGKDALLQKTQGSRYGQVLQNAANKGDDSLNAAHFVLSQRDPDYRKVLEGQ